MTTVELIYEDKAPVTNEELGALFVASWPSYERRDHQAVLSHSLTYVTVRLAGDLVGFVYVAWDGGAHAFLLDVTVHPEHQRLGIGRELVRRATEAATQAGCEWLHVDFEPHLRSFYEACGFRPTPVGVMRLG